MPWAGAYHRRNAPLYAFETCRACHTLPRKSSDEPSPLYYVGYRVPFHTPNADDQPVTSIAARFVPLQIERVLSLNGLTALHEGAFDNLWRLTTLWVSFCTAEGRCTVVGMALRCGDERRR